MQVTVLPASQWMGNRAPFIELTWKDGRTVGISTRGFRGPVDVSKVAIYAYSTVGLAPGYKYDGERRGKQAQVASASLKHTRRAPPIKAERLSRRRLRFQERPQYCRRLAMKHQSGALLVRIVSTETK